MARLGNPDMIRRHAYADKHGEVPARRRGRARQMQATANLRLRVAPR